MASKLEQKTFDEALAWLREHGFDVLEAPGTSGRVFLKKYNVSSAIQKDGESGIKIFAYPGYLVGSEISKLVNKGYQQFLKTSKTEVPATADHLKALHSFSEELKEALGLPSLYNESLGTVSEAYQYDRIEGREHRDGSAGWIPARRPLRVRGERVRRRAADLLVRRRQTEAEPRAPASREHPRAPGSRDRGEPLRR